MASSHPLFFHANLPGKTRKCSDEEIEVLLRSLPKYTCVTFVTLFTCKTLATQTRCVKLPRPIPTMGDVTQQPPAHDPAVGRVLDGRYRVDAFIAAGGMAAVYRATDLRLRRTVAVKIMHAHLASDQAFRDRFLREAVAAARLSHPNVVNVYDQGHDAGLWYLVMEYVPSITVRDLLRRHGRLSPVQALSILDPALSGLQAAHSAGIIHRDLKPENILLADDGRIKLADFGLARAISQHTAPSQSLIGSVAYMSPELISRGNADARSDIYSMGIILYEMVVGHRPFRGSDPVQIALQHANEPMPLPSASDPNLHTEVDELVEWSTQKRPEDRPRSAAILREQVHDVRAALPGDATTDTSVQPANTATRILPTAPTVALPENSTATQALASSPVAAPGVLEHGAPRSLSPRTDPAVQRLQRVTRTRGRRGGLLFITVLLLAALAAGTGWYFGTGPGGMITIPDVVSSAEQDAVDDLNALGFVTTTSSESSLDVPAGSVIRTDPTAGTQAYRGSTVTVITSSGPAEATMPSVIGAQTDLARQALEEAGFVPAEETTTEFSSYDADTVIGLSADGAAVSEGDSLLQGTTVTLTVSLGPVPDVVGQTEQDAVATLEAAGLSADTSAQEFSDTVDAGVVISQDNGGDTVVPGDTISLTVSKGPDLVEVPDVSGMSVTDATATLQEADFVVAIDNDWIPDLLQSTITVTSTDPAAGQSLKRGSTVTLYWLSN